MDRRTISIKKSERRMKLKLYLIITWTCSLWASVAYGQEMSGRCPPHIQQWTGKPDEFPNGWRLKEVKGQKIGKGQVNVHPKKMVFQELKVFPWGGGPALCTYVYNN